MVKKDLTMEELRKKAQAHREQVNTRIRQKYQLAKTLGFTSDEAHFLSFKSEDMIKSLAKELTSKT